MNLDRRVPRGSTYFRWLSDIHRCSTLIRFKRAKMNLEAEGNNISQSVSTQSGAGKIISSQTCLAGGNRSLRAYNRLKDSSHHVFTMQSLFNSWFSSNSSFLRKILHVHIWNMKHAHAIEFD